MGVDYRSAAAPSPFHVTVASGSMLDELLGRSGQLTIGSSGLLLEGVDAHPRRLRGGRIGRAKWVTPQLGALGTIVVVADPPLCIGVRGAIMPDTAYDLPPCDAYHVSCDSAYDELVAALVTFGADDPSDGTSRRDVTTFELTAPIRSPLVVVVVAVGSWLAATLVGFVANEFVGEKLAAAIAGALCIAGLAAAALIGASRKRGARLMVSASELIVLQGAAVIARAAASEVSAIPVVQDVGGRRGRVACLALAFGGYAVIIGTEDATFRWPHPVQPAQRDFVIGGAELASLASRFGLVLRSDRGGLPPT